MTQRDLYRIVTRGIESEWIDLFENEPNLQKKLQDALEAIPKICDEDQLSPSYNNILTCLRLTNLKKIKVIILSQDPYPTLGDAHGLAFSTLSDKCPASLIPILTCLQRSGLTDEISRVYNLSNWSRQGVLLLNTLLTTEIGKIKCHRKIWPEFTNALIQAISKYHIAIENTLIWMLWGRDAQSKIKFIDDYHLIYETLHPSPQAQNNITIAANQFINCTHFLDANKELVEQGHLPIIWDPVIRHMVYTDGSATLNINLKKNNATKEKIDSSDTRANSKSIAAWAYYIHSGPLQNTKNSGVVKTREKLRLCEINDEGTKNSKLYTAYPTSIRAEGIAIIQALGAIYNHPIKYQGIIIIKTDSKFWYDTFNTWKWISNSKIDISTKKNIDIIEKLREFHYKISRDIGSLEVRLIRASHSIIEPDDNDEEAYTNYICNELVDSMAKHAKTNLATV